MDSDRFSKNRTSAPNVEELMQLGIQTARQGNKKNARMIFQQVLATDSQHERAWLWMAAVAETPAERVKCLQMVLSINPNNARAQRELKQFKTKRDSSNNEAITYGIIGLSIVLVLILLVVVVLVLT